MYSLIIVDDEKTMIQNIANSINWQYFGFEIKGIFVSADSALIYLSQNKIDCIISDLKMPGTDGLEFAMAVRNSYPDTVFIILSAFSDFNAAQKAISLDVSNYILKPVTIEKLSHALNKATQTLESRFKAENDSSSHTVFEYSDKYRLLQKLLNHKFSSPEEAIEGFASLGIDVDLHSNSFAMLKISIADFDDFITNNWPYSIDQFNRIFSYIVSTEDKNTILYKFGVGFLELFLVGDKEENFFTFMNRITLNIENNCFELLTCSVNIETINIYPDITSFFSENMAIPQITIDNIINEIMAGASANAHILTRNAISLCQGNHLSISTLAKSLLFNLNKHHDVTEFINCNTIKFSTDNDEKVLYDIIDKACIYFATHDLKKMNFVSAAKEYIDIHYSEELSLSKIAHTVFVSTSHLSRTFKEQTGDSIVNYIRQIRLMHARELLLTSGMNVDEVCYAVGYNSRNLFFKDFKSVYGITPRSLRRDVNNEKK